MRQGLPILGQRVAAALFGLLAAVSGCPLPAAVPPADAAGGDRDKAAPDSRPPRDRGADADAADGGDAGPDAQADTGTDPASDPVTDGGTDAGPDLVACGEPTDTLYVDGVSPNGNGSAKCPYVSITEALEHAKDDPTITTIQISGEGTDGEMIYSAASTGESFPLRPRAGLHLVGPKSLTERAVIVGAGPCETVAGDCTIAVTEVDVTLESLTLRGSSGLGLAVRANGQFTATDLNVEQCANVGVLLLETTRATLSDGILSGNLYGLETRNRVEVTLMNVDAVQNLNDGLRIGGTSTVISTGGRYNENEDDGVDVEARAVFESNGGDEMIANAQNGIEIVSPQSGALIRVDGARISANGAQPSTKEAAGIFAQCVPPAQNMPCVRVRNSNIVGNIGHGIYFENQLNISKGTNQAPPALDLGLDNEPGGNILQSIATPNSLSGVCLLSSNPTPAPARSNEFSGCPGKLVFSTACMDRADVGGTGTLDATCP